MPRIKANDNPEDKNFGDVLKRVRIARGLSTCQLAELLNVTHQQITKYEKGENRLSASMLKLACLKLRVSPLEFFDYLETEEAFVQTGMAVNVSRNFMKIQNRTLRIAINALLAAIARSNA